MNDDSNPSDLVELLLDNVSIAIFIGLFVSGLYIRLNIEQYGEVAKMISFILLLIAGIIGIVYSLIGKKRQKIGIIYRPSGPFMTTFVQIIENEYALDYAKKYLIASVIVLILSFILLIT